MNYSLRYVGISHKTASIGERQKFHISDNERDLWVKSIRSVYQDIRGLLLLVTCNRTEIYIESSMTSACEIRDFIIRNTIGSENNFSRSLFCTCEDTQETVRHLLEVSSGLSSTVLGDAEIIHQIKMAYGKSRSDGLQGSQLERCMQTVFKAHKRISNETAFRDGTTSVAFKALKLIANTFDRPSKDSLKILLMGAGDIVKQLLNYNNKFGFSSLYVANRTEQKAKELVQKFGGYLYDWERVLANDFEDFDAIVTAVSNRPDLVQNVSKRSRKMLLLDLAVPGNIDRRLSELPHVTYYDLDSIAKVLKENHENRMKSIEQVVNIIEQELQDYESWLNDTPIRNFLALYKGEVDCWVNDYIQRKGTDLSPEDARLVTNRIVRRSFKQQGKKLPEQEMELIIEEHI